MEVLLASIICLGTGICTIAVMSCVRLSGIISQLEDEITEERTMLAEMSEA